jgi:ribosome-associated protein
MEPEAQDAESEGPCVPSKSARKRAHRSLQDLGDALMELSTTELERVPLDETVQAAVIHGRGLRKGARSRHVRHLGNLLSKVDAEPIREAVESLRQTSARDAARLHELERWRDRLMGEGDGALQELVVRFPTVDRQQLRALVRSVREERARDAPPRRFRELLRFLRSLQEAED